MTAEAQLLLPSTQSDAQGPAPRSLGRPLCAAVAMVSLVAVSITWVTSPPSSPSALSSTATTPPPSSSSDATTPSSSCGSPDAGPVLGGVDMVDLVLHREGLTPRLGTEEFSATPLGSYTFWFLSTENRDTFLASPESYAPALGGFCAWGLSGRDQMADSTGSLWYANVGDANSHEIRRALNQNPRAYLYMNSDVRDSMDACGEECFTAAEANFRTLANKALAVAQDSPEPYCFNTAMVTGAWQASAAVAATSGGGSAAGAAAPPATAYLPADSATLSTARSSTLLRVLATNEYGTFTAEDFTYPFLAGRKDPSEAVVVEPFRDTTLAAVWHGAASSSSTGCPRCHFQWVLSTTRGTTPPLVLSGDSVVVHLEQTGLWSMELSQVRDGDGVVVHRRMFTVYVKYVRRELRDLTDKDLTDFVAAASTLWKVSTVDGRDLFGPRYYDIYYLALVHNDLAGNQACDFIHGNAGYSFLNVHAALNLMLEQSIQTINPRLSLPFWSYTKDRWLFGDRCPDENGDMVLSDACQGLLNLWHSRVWSQDIFGAPDPETGVIANGAWQGATVPLLTEDLVESAGVTGHFRRNGFATCAGQDDEVCDSTIRQKLEDQLASSQHQANSYGLLRAPWNNNPDPRIIRSQDMCGETNDGQFPSCTALFDQFDKETASFADFILNIQVSPHGTVHVFTGGAFGACGEACTQLQAALGDATTTYALVMAKVSDIQKNLWMGNVKVCPAAGACEGRSPGSDACQCSCPDYTDAFRTESSDDELRATTLWQNLVDTIGISEEEDLALHRDQRLAILDFACHTDTLTGDMLGSNSPLDIAFFPTHCEVERMFQRAMLSGSMSDTNWPTDGDCPGVMPRWRNLWFDYTFDDPDLDSSTLTNEEFLHVLNPASPIHADTTNYLFASHTWAHCDNYATNLGGTVDNSLPWRWG